MKSVSLLVLCLLLGCVHQPILRSPNDREILIAKRLIDHGVESLRAGLYRRAQRQFALSLEIWSSAAAYDGLGCVSVMLGETDKAERFFVRAIETDPEYLQVFANLALLYDLSGRGPQAEKLYKQLLVKDPTNVALRGNFSALLFDIKGKAAAREILESAAILEANPIIEESLDRLEELGKVN